MNSQDQSSRLKTAWWIACAAAVIIIIGVLAGKSPQRQPPKNVAATPERTVVQGTPRKILLSPAVAAADPCSIASSDERIASSRISAGENQSAYDYAVAGLRANANCSDANAALVSKGYLLTMKAFAEHHLSTEDSATDMNQANTLLEECQTSPSYYGTRIGAQCETQQQNNIQTQTNWEMGQ